MTREKISVTIITHNEENNVRDCLESVKWADEIVVVDSGSTDKTIDICRQYTGKVFHNPWAGMKEQKQYAVEKTSHRWILSVDADERVTEDLHHFILHELENPRYDGYRFPRKNYFLGKWLKHGGWYPDHVLRLFRKDRGYFGGTNPHDKVIVESDRVLTVNRALVHYTYTSISQYVSKQALYAGISAREIFSSGKTVRPLVIPLRAFWKFIETYIMKRGFLDGFYGFVVSAGSSYATFWKYLYVWELSRKGVMHSAGMLRVPSKRGFDD